MRVRRRNPRAPRGALGFDQRYKLSSGRTLGPQPAFADESEAREAWQAHREELIEREARMRAGCRPWAFWHWDAGRPDLTRADPDEAIDPADYPGVCPDRVTVGNANGTVSQQPHGGEHAGWCYAAARGQRLHERRLVFLVAHDLLLPGEDPLQGGPDHPAAGELALGRRLRR